MLKLTEAQFSAQVVDLAHYLGYTVAHFRGAWSKDGQRFTTPVQADGAGFPDLVLVRHGSDPSKRKGRLIFAELKAEKGNLSPDQWEWIEALQETKAEVYVWFAGEIEEIEKLLR